MRGGGEGAQARGGERGRAGVSGGRERTKTMPTLRYRIGQLLFNLSDTIADVAIDVAGMREGLENAVRETPEEAELSEAKHKLFVSNLLDRIRYPCPECEGKTLLRLGHDQWVICHECGGTGVDRLVAGR